MIIIVVYYVVYARHRYRVTIIYALHAQHAAPYARAGDNSYHV